MIIRNLAPKNIRFDKLPASVQSVAFLDEFNGSTVDTQKWDIFTYGSPSYTTNVANGYLNLEISSAPDRFNIVGLMSKEKFSIGQTAKIRMRHIRGRHAMFLGLANSISSITGHSNATPAISWYGRSLSGSSLSAGTTTVGSYTDENNVSGYNNYDDVDHSQFHIMEIKRVTSDRVDFIIDGVIKYQLNNILFADNYSVVIAVDSYTYPCSIEVDYIEVS